MLPTFSLWTRGLILPGARSTAYWHLPPSLFQESPWTQGSCLIQGHTPSWGHPYPRSDWYRVQRPLLQIRHINCRASTGNGWAYSPTTVQFSLTLCPFLLPCVDPRSILPPSSCRKILESFLQEPQTKTPPKMYFENQGYSTRISSLGRSYQIPANLFSTIWDWGRVGGPLISG